jgi:hypothetical protein
VYYCKADWDLEAIEIYAHGCYELCSAALTGDPVAIVLCVACLLPAAADICIFIDECSEGKPKYPEYADIVDPNGDKGGACSVE